MLVAKVIFSDVDGNVIQRKYSASDVNRLLDYVGYNVTDECDFPPVKNKLYPGINGIIDITKPMCIRIMPETDSI